MRLFFLCVIVAFLVASGALVSADSSGPDPDGNSLDRYALATSDDVARALSELDNQYASGKRSSQACHLAAHRLGQRAFELSGLSLAILRQAHVCRSGFIHGVFERAMTRLDASNLSSLCSSVSGRPAFMLNCLHGMGHGLYSRFEDVNRSLVSCSTLGPFDAKVCAGGVFMDAFLGGHSERFADASAPNPFSFCQGFPFAEECFRYSAVSFSRRSASATVSARVCLDAPVRFQEACFQGVGVFSAKWNDFDSSPIRTSCARDPTCIEGAAFESGFSGEPIKGAFLCLSTELVESVSCWTHLASGYGYFLSG